VDEIAPIRSEHGRGIEIVRGLPRKVRIVIVKDDGGAVALVSWRELLRLSTWLGLFR
jgi:hypothetical protein